MLYPMGKRETDRETDAELWAHVARSAKPLEKPRRTPSAQPFKPRANPPAKKTAPASRPAPRAAAKQPPAARGETLDRQTSRQLERGRIAVEARIDLHGMRQREAHAALRRFLNTAQGKGRRNVLVITGKGAAPDATRPFYEESGRGVLRQAVPHWLSHPDLAHVVASYSEAPRRLGGEGALYVRLRKSRI